MHRGTGHGGRFGDLRAVLGGQPRWEMMPVVWGAKVGTRATVGTAGWRWHGPDWARKASQPQSNRGVEAPPKVV